MTFQELKQEIRDSVKRYGEIRTTSGAFGDTVGNVGVVEYVDPNERGTFTKYFGCSYLFEGYPDLDVTEQLALGKAFLSEIPREILWKSWYWRTALILMAIFARKRFYHYAWKYVSILRVQLEKLKEANPVLRGYVYNQFVTELKRSLHKSLEKNGYKDPLARSLAGAKPKTGDLGSVIANAAEFFFLFVEMDTAYNFPLRDILENVENNPPRKELNRLYDLFIERSTKFYPTYLRKFVYAKKILSALLYLPSFKRIFGDFLKELDLSKIERDENAWYFCLDRVYDHRGLSLESRQEEKRIMDEENIDLWKHYVEEKSELDYLDWLIT